MKTVYKLKEVMVLYRCENYTQFSRMRKREEVPEPDVSKRLYSRAILEAKTPGITAT